MSSNVGALESGTKFNRGNEIPRGEQTDNSFRVIGIQNGEKLILCLFDRRAGGMQRGCGHVGRDFLMHNVRNMTCAQKVRPGLRGLKYELNLIELDIPVTVTQSTNIIMMLERGAWACQSE